MGRAPSQSRTIATVMARFWEILLVATRLGLTSFGGPVAHIGYFRDEYVVRRKWLDEGTFAELIALCQFLPGPASSQLGMAVGIKRGGLLGGFAAWLGFTLPSALALILFAYGVQELGVEASADWLHGLKIVAVAVVAFALWGMGRTLAPDRTRITIAVVAAAAILLWGGIAAQLLVIGGGAVLGLIILRPPEQRADAVTGVSGGTRAALVLLIAFVALLALLPVASRVTDSLPLDVFDSFYRSGSLVFGGGHVVLPLIEAEVVPPGWVTERRVPGGVRRGAGGAGAVIHVRGLSRSVGGGTDTAVGRRTAGVGGHLCAVVPAGARRAAVLGARAWRCPSAAGADGRERGGGGAAARGAVRSAVDQRHWQAGGFRRGGGGVCAVGVLEGAAVVGGCGDGYRGRGGGAAALGRHAIP